MIWGRKKDDEQEIRTPVEDPEGVIYNDDTSEVFLSRDKIEVLDAISEGRIDGLVTGEWICSGQAGDIGWSKCDPEPYDFAPDTDIRWLRSIYWNDVPVLDSDGKYNYQQVEVSTTKGDPNGAILTSLTDNLQSSRFIGETLPGAPEGDDVSDPKNVDFAKTYRVLNKNVSAIVVSIRVEQLHETIVQGEKAGDIVRSEINYSVYYRAVFSNQNKIGNWILAKAEQIEGKVTSGYIRSTRINVDSANVDEPDFGGWEIRIIRSTPDSVTSRLRNQTFVDSITEIFADVFKYPNTAIVRSKFDAEYFSQIPKRTFDTKLLKVKVPNNYDPISKNYVRSAGAPAGNEDYWDGTFRDDKEWTDNPAWCFYDLITNRRYGLGKYVDSSYVNKWALYEIARYCDQLVPDGFGNLEPRFTCNFIITGRDDAIRVIEDLASIFRGMVYYSAGAIFTVQDAPKLSRYVFNNANVEEGNFNYSSSAKRVRNTVCLVRFNNKDNFYKPEIEVVEDIEAIKRYGLRELSLSALGTTSRGQAVRLGRWALFSEAFETDVVTFNAGLESNHLRPGDIISINDQYKNNRRLSGRLRKIDNDHVNGALVHLDDNIELIDDNTYRFSVLTPTYNFDNDSSIITNTDISTGLYRSSVQDIDFLGSVSSGVVLDDETITEIHFDEKFYSGDDYSIVDDMIYSIELIDGTTSVDIDDPVSGQVDYFRVLRIEEDKPHIYTFTALEHIPTKYETIESGLAFSEQGGGEKIAGSTDFPPNPSNLTLNSRNLTENSKVIDYAFSISDDDNIANFYTYVKQGSDLTDSDVSDDTYLADVLSNSARDGEYLPTSNATYYFRVYAKSRQGAFSVNYASNNINIFGINPIKDVTISSLRTSAADSETNDAGTESSEVITEVSPKFLWQAGIESQGQFPSDLKYRLTVREQSANNSPSSTIYNEVTGFEPSVAGLEYEFDIDDNYALDGGPYRKYDFVVEAHDGFGNSSAGGNFVTDINAGGFRDSIFDNSVGYDIARVDNPRITGLRLTPDGETEEDSLNNSVMFTDQWIDAGGNINIEIITGTTQFSDVRGGYVFYNLDEFVESDTTGLKGGTNRVHFDMEFDQTLINVPVGWSSETIETGWAAFSMYDSFDLSSDNPEDQFFNVSNVVSISKRGLYDDAEVRMILDDLSGKWAFTSGQYFTYTGIMSGIVIPEILDDINYLSGILGISVNDIVLLDSRLDTAESNISTNTSNISTNTANISSNDSELIDLRNATGILAAFHA